MAIKSYKGFDEDLKCRDFQFEIGKKYKEKEVKSCECGFHACKNPLDVFRYYPPARSRYCEVEQYGKISKNDYDSKVASTKINIVKEIGLQDMISAGVGFVLDRSESIHDKGGQSVVNEGYQSAATNNSSFSTSLNIGDQSAAINTGYRSVAVNTGYQSAATSTGNWSVAANTGNWSSAVNTGDQSTAADTGYQSAAVNTGNWSAATNTGDRSAATNTGDCSAAEVSGKGSVAIVTGYQSKARASKGSAIVIAERGDWNGNEYPLLSIKSAIVDGKAIKPNRWYTVKNGKFVEWSE